VQEELRHQVITYDALDVITTVAGADVGFEQGGRITRAAAVALAFPSLALLDRAVAREPTQFPYVPGYLSFREVPAVIAALGRLSHRPDVVLCDGQGLAHPRRFGLACHLGVLTGLATIGVAKSRLIGTHDPVPPEKGAWVPLRDGEEIIGAVLRTRTRVAPLYVSIGHRVSLETAIAIVLRCCPRYRLPETTRLAHRLASG
jgi:deoxyribonuclease V